MSKSPVVHVVIQTELCASARFSRVNNDSNLWTISGRIRRQILPRDIHSLGVGRIGHHKIIPPK